MQPLLIDFCQLKKLLKAFRSDAFGCFFGVPSPDGFEFLAVHLLIYRHLGQWSALGLFGIEEEKRQCTEGFFSSRWQSHS